jgi:hypothetical protein
MTPLSMQGLSVNNDDKGKERCGGEPTGLGAAISGDSGKFLSEMHQPSPKLSAMSEMVLELTKCIKTVLEFVLDAHIRS